MIRSLPCLLISVCLLAQSPQYSKDGNLTIPQNYRDWIFLSSGIGMTYNSGDSPSNPPFENVFVNPSAYREFLKTGTWPDKTVLILEIRSSESQVSINKNGRVQTKIVGIEAHVKDSARGGWGFYNREGKPFPKTADCYSCHEQNGLVDTTFVQFYPTLIDTAKQKGTFKNQP